MKIYRNEWKYLLPEGDLTLLQSRLGHALRPDAHAQGGVYAVHSLYFDDARDSLAAATEAGLFHRFKYRMRYYGAPGENAALHLERKEKAGGFGSKRSCPLRPEQARLLLRGEYAPALYAASDPLLRRFCADALRYGLRPRVVIDYERTAFVEPAGNVRVTLDRALCASRSVDAFLLGGYPRLNLLPGSQGVLEVKFDGLLPGTVRKAVLLRGMQQTSFSKYVLGLRSTERLMYR